MYIYSLAIVSQSYKCIDISQLSHNDTSYFDVKNCIRRLLLQLLYLSRKSAFLVTSNVLGSLKLKYTRQSSLIGILFVTRKASFLDKYSNCNNNHCKQFLTSK